MKRLTIGLFADSFFPFIDGVIMVVDNYARRLLKYGDVIVFAPKYKTPFDDSTLPYKVVRTISIKTPLVDHSLPLPDLDLKFLRKVEKYDLDIVHIHSPFSIGRVGVRYAKKHNKVLIATMHSQFKQDFERFIKSERVCNMLTKKLVIDVFNKCDKCIAVNKGIAKLYYEEYGYKQMPLVLNNATEMVKIDKEKAARTINKKYNINKKDKVFLFVGRLNKLKNIIFIIDALNELEKLKPSFNYKMIFVGSGHDELDLRERINKYGLEDKVLLVGKVSDRELLASFYSRADLFLFPSMYDASSIVQVEASSQDTPTVFIDKSRTSCDIINDETGFKTKEDKEEYAKKIMQVMTDEKLYDKVSKNAYKYVYKTWDNITDDLYKIYLDLYKEKNNENTKNETKE